GSGEHLSMNMLIIFGVAAGCILAGRLWPAMELPRVNDWWGKSYSYQLDSARHHLPCRPDLESLARSRVGLLLARPLRRLVVRRDYLFLFDVRLLLVASVPA